MHPVGPGQLGNRTTGLQVRFDQKSALVHRRPSSNGVSYVLTHLSPMS
jgi:hypothetical protein